MWKLETIWNPAVLDASHVQNHLPGTAPVAEERSLELPARSLTGSSQSPAQNCQRFPGPTEESSGNNLESFPSVQIKEKKTERDSLCPQDLQIRKSLSPLNLSNIAIAAELAGRLSEMRFPTDTTSSPLLGTSTVSVRED